MKGIVINCRTKTVKKIDDGLPIPTPPPEDKPIEVDLAIVAEKLKQIDKNTADIAELKLPGK